MPELLYELYSVKALTAYNSEPESLRIEKPSSHYFPLYPHKLDQECGYQLN
jgi:hypothetical protein